MKVAVTDACIFIDVIIWILDQLVHVKLLSGAKACSTLNQLASVNSMLGGVLMKKEVDKRVISWGSSTKGNSI